MPEVVQLVDGMQAFPAYTTDDFVVVGDATTWKQIVTSPLLSDGAADDTVPAIIVKANTKVTLNDVVVLNSRSYGIEVKAGGTLICNHCWISNSLAEGIYAPTDTVSLSRTLVEDNGINKDQAEINAQTMTILDSVIDGEYGKDEILTGSGTVIRSVIYGGNVGFFTGSLLCYRCSIGKVYSTSDNDGLDSRQNLIIHTLSAIQQFPTGNKQILQPRGRLLMPTDDTRPCTGCYKFNVITDLAWANDRWGADAMYQRRDSVTGPQAWKDLPYFPGDVP